MRTIVFICVTVILGSCQLSQTNFNKQKFTRLQKIDHKDEVQHDQEVHSDDEIITYTESAQGLNTTKEVEPTVIQEDGFIDSESKYSESADVSWEFDYPEDEKEITEEKEVMDPYADEDEEEFTVTPYDKGVQSMKYAGLTFLTGALLTSAVVLCAVQYWYILAIVLLVLLAIDVIAHFFFVYHAEVWFNNHRKAQENEGEERDEATKSEKSMLGFSRALSIFSGFAMLGATFGFFGLMVLVAIS